MRKIVSLLIVTSILTACGGRAANPITVSQYGDEKKSCDSLEFEIKSTEGEIAKLLPKTEKTGKNVALGVAGAFFLVPWFFMDLSHAEQEEVNALRQRYNHLGAIAVDKKCGYEVKQVPAFDKQSSVPVKQSEYPSARK